MLRHLFKLCSIGILCLGCQQSLADNALQPMVVKHLSSSYSPALKPYLYDILKLTLDLTVEEYGPYVLELNHSDISAARAKVETENGNLINVVFTTGWVEQDNPHSKIVSFEIPLFNYMLGLRELIVGANSPFSAIPQTRSEFIQYKAGQGLGWEDVKILKASGVEVIEAPTFEALFPMLQKGRFDYLPLSALEIDDSFEREGIKFPGMKILPQVYIYYPMLISLNVNGRQKNLAERIELGLSKAKGEPFNQLFNQHFPNLRFAKKSKNALFMAKNVFISEAKNKEITHKFMQLYGDYFYILN